MVPAKGDLWKTSNFVPVQGRGKYCADGCASRLEKMHCVQNLSLTQELGKRGRYAKVSKG